MQVGLSDLSFVDTVQADRCRSDRQWNKRYIQRAIASKQEFLPCLCNHTMPCDDLTSCECCELRCEIAALTGYRMKCNRTEE